MDRIPQVNCLCFITLSFRQTVNPFSEQGTAFLIFILLAWVDYQLPGQQYKYCLSSENSGSSQSAGKNYLRKNSGI